MPEIEFWLVILFLSRKKFHAKHFFVLSGFVKSGPSSRRCIMSFSKDFVFDRARIRQTFVLSEIKPRLVGLFVCLIV